MEKKASGLTLNITLGEEGSEGLYDLTQPTSPESYEKDIDTEKAEVHDASLKKRASHIGSVQRSIYSVVCSIAGVGVLGLPFTLKQGGWGSIAILIILGLILLYTGIRLSHCLIASTDVTTYAELGHKAFGRWGKYGVLISQMVNCIGSSVLFLVLGGQNLSLIAQDLDVGIRKYQWTLIVTAIALPFCYLKTMHEVGIVAFFGVLSCVLAVIIVIIEDFVATGPNVIRSSIHNTGSFSGFLKASATMCFAYGGHVIFPSVIHAMGSNARKFPRAVYWSYTIVIIMYIPVAVISFYMFGDLTEDNILKNLGNSVPIKITEAALAIHVIFAYVVYMNPVFFLIERKVHLDQLAMKFEDRRKDANSWYIKWIYASPELILRITLRTLVVGFTVLIAILVPFFSDLMSFIGGSAQVASILILPALIYLKLYRFKMPFYEVIFGIVIVVLGTLVGIAATVYAVIDIVGKISKDGINFNI
jgi:amino acid permease